MQLLRLRLQLRREIVLGEDVRDPRCMRLRGERIGLNLAQCDRPLGQSAIRVEDQIIGILPALVGEAVLAFPRIFDEPVAVPIAIFVDPAQRRPDVRPDRPDCIDVAGAVEIHAREHHEKRRRIDGAIIHAKRNLAEPRHFAVARLMQDLPGCASASGSIRVACVALR